MLKPDKARIYITFGNAFADGLIVLSATDSKEDSDGNRITFTHGLPVSVYEESDENDNLIADGVAIRNTYSSYPHIKWLFVLDDRGIRYQCDEIKQVSR